MKFAMFFALFVFALSSLAESNCSRQNGKVGYYSLKCSAPQFAIEIEGKRPYQRGNSDIRQLTVNGESLAIERTFGCRQWIRTSSQPIEREAIYQRIFNECSLNDTSIEAEITMKEYIENDRVKREVIPKVTIDGPEWGLINDADEYTFSAEQCEVTLECL